MSTIIYRSDIFAVYQKLRGKLEGLPSIWKMSFIISVAITTFTLNISLTNFSEFLLWIVKDLIERPVKDIS